MTPEIHANITATDDTFNTFIIAAVHHPFTISLLIVLLTFAYMVYRKPKEAWSFIKSALTFKIFIKHKPITKEDLLNHQLFKDLQYFIEYKINNLYNQNTFQNLDKAKLLMAHDLLMVKMQDVLKWTKCIVSNYDLDDPYINIRNILRNKIDKHNALIWSEWKELGIPELFINKFIEVSRVHSDYVSLVLDDLLSDKIPLSIYERIFLVLGCLNQYYTTIILRTKDVIQSINGDLKGLIYKGLVIGGNDYKYYPVPCREYIPIVEKKLQEVSLATKAKRVGIYTFHDFVGDDYLQGHFSKLYEYDASGFLPLISKFQYKSAALLSDILSDLKQHQGKALNSNKINEVYANLLVENGISSIIVYPIFLYDKLRGFLALEYNSAEVFDKYNNDNTMELIKKYSALLNIYLDYTKTGFNYSNNRVQE